MSEAARRLRRLEAKRGLHKPCPECGFDPLQNPGQIEYRIEWPPSHTEEEIEQLIAWYNRGMPLEEMPSKYREPEPPDKHCPGCGRLLEVGFSDVPTPDAKQARLQAEWFAEKGWERYEEEIAAESEVPDYPPEGWNPTGWNEGGGIADARLRRY